MKNKKAFYITTVLICALMIIAAFLGDVREVNKIKEESICRSPWLLLSPGMKTIPIQVVPEEHGKLVGWGPHWLVIFDPDTGEAEVRHGLSTYYATVTFGQVPPGYCGALHVRLDQQFWSELEVYF